MTVRLACLFWSCLLVLMFFVLVGGVVVVAFAYILGAVYVITSLAGCMAKGMYGYATCIFPVLSVFACFHALVALVGVAVFGVVAVVCYICIHGWLVAW